MTLLKLHNHGVSLYQDGEFEAARRVFEQTALHLGLSVPSSPAAPPQANPHSYIYQRERFEEGFSTYHALKCSREESLSASILYHLGLLRKDTAMFVKATNATGFSSRQLRFHCLYAYCQTLYHQGKLDLEPMEEALRVARALGSDPLVGRALNALGVLCYHRNALEEAAKFFRESLPCLEGTQKATVYNNLGRVHVQSDNDLALDMYRKAYSIRKLLLGTTHLDTAATAFNVGQSLHKKGALEESLEFYKLFYRVALRELGSYHRDVATALSWMAQIQNELGNLSQALRLHKESLMVATRALSGKHPDVATLLNRLGNFYYERGEYDKALETYQTSLEIDEAVLEENHPNLVITLSNIAEIHRQQRNWDLALKTFQRALEIQMQAQPGGSTMDAASTFTSIATIYQQQNLIPKALEYLELALELRSDPLEIASTLMHQGSLLYRKGLITKALEKFEMALARRIQVHGTQHRDVSFTRYNIGLCYQSIGNHQAALEAFEETLRVEHLLLGTAHKDVAMTLFKLGQVHFSSGGKMDKALQYLVQALEIETSPRSLARILHLMGNIYLSKGNTQQMMECFQRAARILQRAGISASSISAGDLWMPGDYVHDNENLPAAAA